MATSSSGTSASMVSPAGYGSASALIWGYKWGAEPMGSPVTVTWSMPTASSSYASHSLYGGRGETTSWSPFSAAEQSSARSAVLAWDKVSAIKLTKIADSGPSFGDMRFALTKADNAPGLLGHAYSPGTDAAAGDVWMQYQNWHADHAAAVTPGSDDYVSLLHEIGHALGLKHPFASTSTSPTKLGASQDSYFHTVMSYSAKPGLNSQASFYPTTPMYLDIVAIQALYGKDTTTNAGDTVYRFSSTQEYWQTIYDAGGRDAVVYSGATACAIDLRPGKFSALSAPITFSNGSSSRATVCIGPDTVIESATGGSGNDRIIGNQAANALRGGAGNDVFYGELGNDSLYGGLGQDIFIFNRAASSKNLDRIADFNVKDDTIRLENGVFKALKKTGTLASGAFHTGPQAHDASDRIVYNKATGSLFYDEDGTGAMPQVEFARLAKSLAMTSSDFLVI